jgi:hypothetical protein
MLKPTTFLVLTLLFLTGVRTYAEEGLRSGVPAPDFSLPTVKKQVVTLKDAAAKGTVVLHFWKSK